MPRSGLPMIPIDPIAGSRTPSTIHLYTSYIVMVKQLYIYIVMIKQLYIHIVMVKQLYIFIIYFCIKISYPTICRYFLWIMNCILYIMISWYPEQTRWSQNLNITRKEELFVQLVLCILDIGSCSLFSKPGALVVVTVHYLPNFKEL